jgi:hypothetical protein
MLEFRRALISAVAMIALASPAFAEWGDLKIKFKLTKATPAKAPAPIIGAGEANAGVPFDATAVGPALEVPNVMVWLHTAEPAKFEVHPELAEKTAIQKPHLQIKGGHFAPHCLIVTAGQTLNLTNEDAIGYNPRIEFAANPSFNPLMPAGSAFEAAIMKVERRLAPASCSIHFWLQGWVMVAPTPYHAVSDPTGAITIKDLPVGKWEFKFWHEVHGAIANVERAGKSEKWPRGITSITIAKGENDLGEILIVPKE